MTGLPKLPGLEFSDPTITKFHLSQTFNFINGYRIPRTTFTGAGGKELDTHHCGLYKPTDPVRYDPSLTYGRVKGPTIPKFEPHFALYDKKCLSFKAFFKQSVFESPDEHYRIRHVNIIYFLEDDSITVMEPFVQNCGFQQGRLIRRGKIPKTVDGTFWHWKDLNVGIDVCFNGIVFHIVECDGFTKEYLTSQGIVLNPKEDMPPDPYIQIRELKSQLSAKSTPPLDDSFRRFLEYDGKILRFKTIWDNRDAEFGELKEYDVLYYLADDTVSVKENHKVNDGTDPCPLLLKKTRLPKNWKDTPVNYPSVYLELSPAEVTEYYQPKDFRIGETIFILGRRFLIYDCDSFTRNYFENVLHMTQGPPIDMGLKPMPIPQKCMPPHGELRLGTLEDSLQNCFQCVPRAPRQDEIKLIINANKYLRYTMKLDWCHPEDEIREFLLLYSLARGTCQIFEPPLRNSGIIGGKFLKDTFITKPESHPYNPDYYTPADFYIGAIIHVYARRFIITGADLSVYRYMQANPEKFPEEVVDNMRNYMFNQGFLKNDLEDNVIENKEKQRQEEISKIGAELKEIKTEREKCLELIDTHFIESNQPNKQLTTESDQFNKVLNTQNLPYERETCEYGIKPVEKECPYPVTIGDYDFTKKPPCPENPESYTVVYPVTEEEKLKKYYDEVLRRHEEACLQAAEYKKTAECLPGTVSHSTDPELSKKVLASPEAFPSPEKYNPCLRRQVKFYEPPDKCAHEKDDISLEKIPKTTCGCTTYPQK